MAPQELMMYWGMLEMLSLSFALLNYNIRLQIRVLGSTPQAMG
jgi:hypothetical protein